MAWRIKRHRQRPYAKIYKDGAISMAQSERGTLCSAGRRGQGMRFKLGSITTRKDRPGYWTATFYVNDKRCRRSFAKLDYPKKAEVRRCILEELNNADKADNAKTVSACVEEFFSVNSTSLKDDSARAYHLFLDKLVKAYGDVEMNDLTLADLEEWIAAYSLTGVSPASVNSAIRTLRRFCNWAEARGDASKNAAKGLRFRRVPEKNCAALSEEEIPRFLEVCTPGFKPIAQLALMAGLRRREVVNLKWSAVDLERGVLEVRNDGGFTTKSGKNRVIPLHPDIVKTLKEITRTSDYVFPESDGKKRSDTTNWFCKSVKLALKKANIDRRFNFHSLRHTFATRLALYAGDMEAARRILGHSDVLTTRIYVHPTDQLVRAVGKIPGLSIEKPAPEISPESSVDNKLAG